VAADPLSGWDDATRAATRAAFAASGRGYSAAAFQDFDRLLTAWTADSVAAARAACTDARGRQPADLGAAREGCLQRASRDARALVSLSAHADQVFVDHAAQAVRALPSLSGCADPALVRATTLPPSDPAIRREVERLADRLSAARTLLDAGAWSAGRAAATEVATAAGATGFRPLVAEALLLRGSAENLTGASAQAEITLRQAASEADAASDDRLRAQALSLLVRVVGEALSRPVEAEALLPMATGALARARSPPEIRAQLDASRSQIAYGRGDYAQAVTAMQSAVATWERLGDRGTVGLAQALAELSAVEVSRGSLDAAEAAARRSLAVGAFAFPPGHPARSDVLSTLGGVRLRKGDAREASALLATLAQELEASLGPAHPDALWAKVLWGIAQLGADRPLEAASNLRRALAAAPGSYPRRFTILRQLGTAELDLGETGAGLAHLEEAYRLQAATPGQNLLDEAAGRAYLARGLIAAGRGREALEHARAAVAALAGKVPAESERMALARLVLGRALAMTGKGTEAIAELEAALAAQVKMTTFAVRRAETRFALAQLVADRARAGALAREALADLDALGQRAPWRADLEAWLARPNR